MNTVKKIITAALVGASVFGWGYKFTAAGEVGLVSTDGGYLNVRQSPSMSSARISTLSHNTYVTLLDRVGDWWQVEFADGSTGYCYGEFIEEAPSEVRCVSVESGSLNVRVGSGTFYKKVDSLYDGDEVHVLWYTGEWAKILYDGTKTGYVHGAYLREGSGSSENECKGVSLDIPYFNQKDSRWKNVTLGNSSRTVGNAGCVTTCIAMAESFLYGYAVTPGFLAKNLTYSRSGDLYWPESYRGYWGSDYLRVICDELEKGRPVLVGGKNAYGGQHWVLVTGFLGGAVKAENFTIHDPGRSDRKTLDEFFGSFPYFYKAVTVR